jgi:hypothetical protein
VADYLLCLEMDIGMDHVAIIFGPLAGTIM